MARKTVDPSIDNIEFNFKYNKKQLEALTTPATEVLFGGAKGCGKAVDINTDILTTSGWKKMKEVHPGDYVFDESGNPTKVVAEVDVLSEDSYEVVFGRGKTSIICDKNHKWVTGTLYNRRRLKEGYISEKEAFTTKTTQEIMDTLYFEDSGQPNHVIRKAKKLHRQFRRFEPTELGINIHTGIWSITDIRKVDSRPMKCIQVEAKSHQYLAGRHLIPTHNSYLARQAAVTYAFNIPGLQVYIFRESYSEVKRNYLFGADGFESMLSQLEMAGLCNINASEPRIHFYNGSDIYLRHMNNPQDVEQIRGNDVHVLIADESAQWLVKDIYFQLRTCMRCGLEIDYDHLEKIGLSFIKPGFFPRALLLSNPGGRAHAFIKQEFIDSLEPGEIKQMPEDKGGMFRQFIPAFLEDNSALLKTDPNYKAKLLGSGKHVRAMLEGDWSIPDGAALADEWSSRWNVVKPFDIPPNAIIKRCFDWGIAKPFAVTYVWETRHENIELADGNTLTFSPGTMIVVGELYGWNGNADEGCRKTAKVVGEMIKRYESAQPWASQIQPGPSDGSIWNGTGTDKTINDDVVDGFNAVQGDSSGYGNTMRSVLFIKADKSKGSRAKGLAMVKSYLYGAHGDEIDGVVYPSEKPGLIFFDTCKHCIRTLPVIPFDQSDPDDVDSKAEDHLYDTIRYAVLGRTAHFERLELSGV